MSISNKLENGSIIIQVPFEGFYYSVVDSYIEEAITQESEYREEEGLTPFADQEVNFSGIAKSYVNCLNEYIEDQTGLIMDMMFDGLSSPREYNFTTDRIFCTITPKNLVKLKHHAFKDKQALQNRINKLFKSCEGFASFYDEFCNEWETKKLSQWDANELLCLFPEIDNYSDIYENFNCNFSEDVRNNIEFI